MPSGVKISELDQAESLTFNDLVEISRPETINEVLSYQSHSASIKQLSEVIVGATRLGYFRYWNPSPITVGSSKTKICTLANLSLLQDTDADIWTEFTINTQFNSGSNIIKAYITYYHNGVEMPRYPIETWNIDGQHTVNLGYHLRDLRCDQGHKWEVYLRLEGGIGTIETGDTMTVITVIGFSEEQRWDGTISGIEEIPEYTQKYSLKDIVDTLNIQINDLGPRGQEFKESISKYNQISNLISIRDTTQEGVTKCVINIHELDYVLRCEEDNYEYYSYEEDNILDQQSIDSGLY